MSGKALNIWKEGRQVFPPLIGRDGIRIATSCSHLALWISLMQHPKPLLSLLWLKRIPKIYHLNPEVYSIVELTMQFAVNRFQIFHLAELKCSTHGPTPLSSFP
jgi:hypothetical protein